MSSMESQQNAEAVNYAKQQLESQAKETQDKMGGPENSSVVTAQVVVPSDVGKKAQEVYSGFGVSFRNSGLNLDEVLVFM